jgi:hypothetical protein
MTNNENKYSGGETTIDKDFENAEIYDTPQAPVESVDKTTQTSTTTDSSVVVTPPEDNVTTNQTTTNTQPEINYTPGFEDAEIEGNIVIGDTPSAASVSEDSVDSFLDNLDSIVENMSIEEFEAAISDGVFTSDEQEAAKSR